MGDVRHGSRPDLGKFDFFIYVVCQLLIAGSAIKIFYGKK